MSLKAFFSSLVLVLVLSACGGGKEEQNVNHYPVRRHHQNNVAQPGANFCSTATAEAWRRLVASSCQNVNGAEHAHHCLRGTERFQRKNRSGSCAIPSQAAQWSPDENWQYSQFVLIDDALIQRIYQKYSGRWGQHPGPAGHGGPITTW